MTLEDYDVIKSKRLCSEIKTKLGVACSYGYCGLGEYTLFLQRIQEDVRHHDDINYSA